MGIELKNVYKSLGTADNYVLSDISFRIEDGEFVALTGRSGSGKSTLLYVISTLDNPSSGQILISDKDISKMSQPDLHELRNLEIGFVFQFHYLLAELTALENVLMPAVKTKQEDKVEPRARELLSHFGLGKKLDRLPRQLSGGEQQRVAIARALSLEPRYLFADEPTGSLDSVNGEAVMKILLEMNATQKTTIVLVTHEADYAKQAPRQIRLADGRVVGYETSR